MSGCSSRCSWRRTKRRSAGVLPSSVWSSLLKRSIRSAAQAAPSLLSSSLAEEAARPLGGAELGRDGRASAAPLVASLGALSGGAGPALQLGRRRPLLADCRSRPALEGRCEESDGGGPSGGSSESLRGRRNSCRVFTTLPPGRRTEVRFSDKDRMTRTGTHSPSFQSHARGGVPGEARGAGSARAPPALYLGASSALGAAAALGPESEACDLEDVAREGVGTASGATPFSPGNTFADDFLPCSRSISASSSGFRSSNHPAT